MYRLSLLLPITVILFLSACVSTQNQQISSRNEVTKPASFYLAQAAGSGGLEKQTYLLQASAADFYYGNVEAGRQTLYKVQPKVLEPLQFAQYQLLNARLALIDKQAQRALSVLLSLDNNPYMTSQMQAEQLQLRANAQQQLNMTEASLQTRIQLTQQLTNVNDKEENQQQIWRQLGTIDNKTLQTLSDDSTNPTLQGWAALALSTRQYANQPQQLLQQLRYWQSQYPSHPANALVSTDISHFKAWLKVPSQIAVLLPLQGPLSAQAQAVFNGILLAYYQALQQQLPVPVIKVYDTTTSEDISTLYQQAITDGAQFVIGPLTKANVQLLQENGRISVPSLALNYSPANRTLPKNFYEFALSPENEAIAVANRGAQLGYINAITLTPAGKWGTNIVDAFTQDWLQDNGVIVNTLAYPLNTALKNQIATLLNINQSYWRKRQLQKLIGQSLKFSARRRRDIDMIFLNAFPQTARQIIPLLRFYYAGSVPVYATSQIYNGIPNATRDRDLNGVRFTIMPWAINPSTQAMILRKRSQQLWPNSFKQYSLLYAFGIDAYTLMTHMSQLQVFPKFGLVANTGTLFITPSQRIRRQLEWAEFKNGVPTLLAAHDTIIMPMQNN